MGENNEEIIFPSVGISKFFLKKFMIFKNK